MSDNIEDARAHPVEWILVGIEATLLVLLWHKPEFLRGQLLPSLALGLAPGCAMRLAGQTSLSTHRFGVALGLVTFMFTNGTLHLTPMRGMIENWTLVLAALVMISLGPVCGALRWRWLLQAHDIQLTFGESLRLVLVGSFFNIFAPGASGGDMFRAYAVARGREKTAEAITTVFLDRMLGLPGLIIMVAGSALLNWSFLTATPSFRPYAWAVMVALLVALAALAVIVLTAFVFSEHLIRLEESIPGGKTLSRVSSAIATYRHHGKALLLAITISFVSHVGTVGACCCLGAAAGINEIPVTRYFLLVPMGLTVNSLPLSPGGLGVGEVAFARLFDAAAPEYNYGSRGALTMLGLRLGLILCGLVGGAIYALGRHNLDAALTKAKDAQMEY